MRKILLAGVALACFAAPANAAYITGSLVFDITVDYLYGTSNHFGATEFSFSGDTSGRLNSGLSYPVNGPCTACLIYTISGNSILFERNPRPIETQSYRIRLYFDRDLEGDILNAAQAIAISGHVQVDSHTTAGTSYSYGPLISAQIYAPIPEPASWAMMIGGFAMLGGALRARRVRHGALTTR